MTTQEFKTQPLELRHDGQLDLRTTPAREFYVVRADAHAITVLRVSAASYSDSGLTVTGISYDHFQLRLQLATPCAVRTDGSTYKLTTLDLGPNDGWNRPRERTYLLRDLVFGRTTRGGRTYEVSEAYATWEQARARIRPLISRNSTVLLQALHLLTAAEASAQLLAEAEDDIIGGIASL